MERNNGTFLHRFSTERRNHSVYFRFPQCVSRKHHQVCSSASEEASLLPIRTYNLILCASTENSVILRALDLPLFQGIGLAECFFKLKVQSGGVCDGECLRFRLNAVFRKSDDGFFLQPTCVGGPPSPYPRIRWLKLSRESHWGTGSFPSATGRIDRITHSHPAVLLQFYLFLLVFIGTT